MLLAHLMQPRPAQPNFAGMSEAVCLQGGFWDLFHFEAPKEMAQMLYAQVGCSCLRQFVGLPLIAGALGACTNRCAPAWLEQAASLA